MVDHSKLDKRGSFYFHEESSSGNDGSDQCSICLSSIMSSSASSEEEDRILQRFKAKIKSFKRKASRNRKLGPIGGLFQHRQKPGIRPEIDDVRPL